MSGDRIVRPGGEAITRGLVVEASVAGALGTSHG
jgi:hypothetical protein